MILFLENTIFLSLSSCLSNLDTTSRAVPNSSATQYFDVIPDQIVLEKIVLALFSQDFLKKCFDESHLLFPDLEYRISTYLVFRQVRLGVYMLTIA